MYLQAIIEKVPSGRSSLAVPTIRYLKVMGPIGVLWYRFKRWLFGLKEVDYTKDELLDMHYVMEVDSSMLPMLINSKQSKHRPECGIKIRMALTPTLDAKYAAVTKTNPEHDYVDYSFERPESKIP